MRGLCLVLALSAPAGAAEDVKLASLRELLGFVSAYQNDRPLGVDERKRAWSALWASESELPPEVLSRLRELLLKVDEESGPLRGLAKPRASRPDPASVTDAKERDELYRDVDELAYPPEIKTLFSRIVQYAALEDARVAVEIARKEKPSVELDSRELGSGSLGRLARSRRSPPSIRLKPGVALVPAARADDRVPQLSAGGTRYYAIPASTSYYRRLSAPIPALDVFKPGARSKPGGAYYGGEIFVYPDGSAYHRFSDEHLAGVLLHELFHLDTRRRGGGASTEADELRSFLPQFRLYYRVQRKLGTADFLDLNRQGYASWLSNPMSLSWFLEAAYSPDSGDGESVGVFDSIDQTRAILSLEGGAFEAAKRRAVARETDQDEKRRGGELGYLSYIGLSNGPPETAPASKAAASEETDKEYRRELKARLARLETDAQLELETRLEDFSWRESEGVDADGPAASAR